MGVQGIAPIGAEPVSTAVSSPADAPSPTTSLSGGTTTSSGTRAVAVTAPATVATRLTVGMVPVAAPGETAAGRSSSGASSRTGGAAPSSSPTTVSAVAVVPVVTASRISSAVTASMPASIATARVPVPPPSIVLAPPTASASPVRAVIATSASYTRWPSPSPIAVTSVVLAVASTITAAPGIAISAATAAPTTSSSGLLVDAPLRGGADLPLIDQRASVIPPARSSSFASATPLPASPFPVGTASAPQRMSLIAAMGPVPAVDGFAAAPATAAVGDLPRLGLPPIVSSPRAPDRVAGSVVAPAAAQPDGRAAGSRNPAVEPEAPLRPIRERLVAGDRSPDHVPPARIVDDVQRPLLERASRSPIPAERVATVVAPGVGPGVAPSAEPPAWHDGVFRVAASTGLGAPTLDRPVRTTLVDGSHAREHRTVVGAASPPDGFAAGRPTSLAVAGSSTHAFGTSTPALGASAPPPPVERSAPQAFLLLDPPSFAAAAVRSATPSGAPAPSRRVESNPAGPDDPSSPILEPAVLPGSPAVRTADGPVPRTWHEVPRIAVDGLERPPAPFASPPALQLGSTTAGLPSQGLPPVDPPPMPVPMTSTAAVPPPAAVPLVGSEGAAPPSVAQAAMLLLETFAPVESAPASTWAPPAEVPGIGSSAIAEVVVRPRDGAAGPPVGPSIPSSAVPSARPPEPDLRTSTATSRSESTTVTTGAATFVAVERPAVLATAAATVTVTTDRADTELHPREPVESVPIDPPDLRQQALLMGLRTASDGLRAQSDLDPPIAKQLIGAD